LTAIEAKKYDRFFSIFERSKMAPSTASATSGLIKNHLSDQLRSEILNGSLKPGKRIVEGKWAAKFGVAQASIRETINILAQEGFVTKAPGRSARVIHLSETDIGHIYQLRGAIEGLAARFAAQSPQDLNDDYWEKRKEHGG
jgi:DNA-binding GntR family transcriptional regulator